MSAKNGHFNQSLGSLVEHQVSATHLTLYTDIATVEISCLSTHTFRIYIRKSIDLKKTFSYAIATTPNLETIQVADLGDTFKVTLPAGYLTITKIPIRFSFYTASGILLSTDDPAFGTSWIGNEVTTYKALQPEERFIGLGEKNGNLDRRGTAYTNWNTDKFTYPTDHDPLYMSIPFYIGLHSGVQYGIFFDNTHRAHFNFGASNDRFSSFGAADGEMDYYFFYGDTVADIITHYTALTGRINMPPLWSLGTQQCRYSYYPDSEVIQLAQTYRDKGIPADVIYLDIHYMDAYKVFTFHPSRFPKPAAMIKRMREMGFHVVVILDPGIKIEAGYAPYEEGKSKNYFVKYPDGTDYAGEVWPGWSHFPDFTHEGVRQWWGEQLKFYTDLGIDGFWNDMNEPAAWGQSLPDLIEFQYEGEYATHKKARNVYGMQMARSTSDGATTLLPSTRPFTLNRAGYSGVQRYTATWTGDNVASDDHMVAGVRLVNSLGLSGVPFAGYDVGGFAAEASPALFARWLVLGAFSPLFRFHSMINSRDSEPWSYGEEVEEIAKHYISLRYRLMPYMYSHFYESSQTGIPIARSLALYHPHDPRTYSSAYQNQYYFGHAIMIPVVQSHQEYIKCLLPGLWYDLHTGFKINDTEYIAPVRNERYPLFVRGSAILTMQSVVHHAAQQPTDTLEIHLYYGVDDNSVIHYEDDGISHDNLKGIVASRTLYYSPSTHQFTLSATEGSYISIFKKIRLYLHGFEHLQSLKVNGKATEIISTDYVYVPPVSSFDPFYHAQVTDMVNRNVPTVTFEYAPTTISIELI